MIQNFIPLTPSLSPQGEGKGKDAQGNFTCEDLSPQGRGEG